MNKTLFVLPIAALILLGAGCADTTPITNTETTPSIAVGEPNPSIETNTGDTETKGEVKEFTVNGGNFTFTPAIINVNEGDTVRITFKNEEGFHDLKIDEFNVATQQIRAGEEETIEFVADKSGSFEYYCTVGKHREMGMKGTLIVQ